MDFAERLSDSSTQESTPADDVGDSSGVNSVTSSIDVAGAVTEIFGDSGGDSGDSAKKETRAVLDRFCFMEDEGVTTGLPSSEKKLPARLGSSDLSERLL